MTQRFVHQLRFQLPAKLLTAVLFLTAVSVLLSLTTLSAVHAANNVGITDHFDSESITLNTTNRTLLHAQFIQHALARCLSCRCLNIWILGSMLIIG